MFRSYRHAAAARRRAAPVRSGSLALVLAGAAVPACAAVPVSVEAEHEMVVSVHHLATEAGVEILKAGGNAIDAAVAVGYALAVVNPCCGNIGGGGFMVVHLADGKERFLDFREKAPLAAKPDMYVGADGGFDPKSSQLGWKSVAVPATVPGLEAAHDRWGHLPRAKLLAPAIRLARDGFVLTRADTDILGWGTESFRKDPGVAHIFLRPDGSPLRPGDRLVQADLAKTLTLIAARGAEVFRTGPVPEAIARASAAGGGILTTADFTVPAVDETDPLTCQYRAYRIVSAPPPSSGGVTMCEILNILEGYDLAGMGFHSAASVHVMTEAMRYAYTDRNNRLGDPAFVKNPLDQLLSKDYAAEIRGKIDPDHATPSAQLTAAQPAEKRETTHYSIVDRAGNAVAVTYTLNGGFGSGVMAPGTGFFLNDEMDDFTVKAGSANLYGLVQGEANAIAAGKRPLSSMTPTIVLRDDKPWLVAGSPGGSRIITITLETLLNVIDYGMTPSEAVDAPRFHMQAVPDVLFAEPYAFSPDTAKLLQAMGYTIKNQTSWGASELIELGAPVEAAKLGVAGHDSAASGAILAGHIYGANDDRRPAGSAAGD